MIMDVNARMGTHEGDYTGDCRQRPCMGHSMMIVQDYSGFLNKLDAGAVNRSNAIQNPAGLTSSGQILFNDPAYVSNADNCADASALGLGFFQCPQQPSNNLPAFKQYTAIFRDDNGGIVSGPIIVTRFPDHQGFGFVKGSNSSTQREFAGFAQHDCPCPIRLKNNRFPFFIADGLRQKVRITGSLDDTSYIRWEAPSSANVAVLDIFIQKSLQINVFVGSSKQGPWTLVPKQLRIPTFSDPAGANARDSFHRNLTITVRGGTNNFYMIQYVPAIQVSLTMDMDVKSFFADTFIANIATLLRVPASRIKVVSVKAGSVVVDFNIEPSNTVATNVTAAQDQMSELKNITRYVCNTCIYVICVCL